MKTRTLLLLALGCGVAILLAGGVLLVQLANRAEADAPVPLGEPRRIGDATVTVDDATEVDGVLEVAVRVGGVDDPEGLDDFRLIAAARPAPRLVPDDGELPACDGVTVAPVACLIAFDVRGADGDSRVLLFRRGDSQARWALDTA